MINNTATSMSDKKTVFFHCFLFTIAPPLFLFAHNMNELVFQPGIMLSRILIMLGFTGIICLFIKKILKNDPRYYILYSLFIIWFFAYGNAHEFIRSYVFIRVRYLVLAWFGLLLLLWPTLWFLKKTNTFNLNKIFNFISAVLIIIISLNIGYFFLNNRSKLNIEHDIADSKMVTSNRPDIYYIILDSYMRADVLKEFYNYDNSAFIQNLEEKGFYVCDKSNSNYAFTGVSMSSSLNMQYINFLADSFGVSSNNKNALSALITNNKVQETVKSQGYKYISLGSWANITSSDDRFKYLKLNECDISLLNLTILKPVSSSFYSSQVRNRILSAFDVLNETPQDTCATFTYAHILSPHPPFVFGPNGEETNLFENIARMHLKESYIDQVKFLNKKVDTLLSGILSKSENCIIVLQADHGAGYIFDPTLTKADYNDLSEKFIKSQMGILNAIYVNQDCKKNIPRDLTPVNTFRIIFNHYFHSDYKLLDNKNYFSTHERPYKFEDVTGLVN